MHEVVAVAQTLIVLRPVAAIGIDRALRRGAVVRHRGLPMCNRHAGRPHSDVYLFGLSNDLASSRSTRGRGILGRVVVGDSAVLTLPAPPTIYTQMTGTGRAAVGWRICSSP